MAPSKEFLRKCLNELLPVLPSSNQKLIRWFLDQESSIDEMCNKLGYAKGYSFYYALYGIAQPNITIRINMDKYGIVPLKEWPAKEVVRGIRRSQHIKSMKYHFKPGDKISDVVILEERRKEGVKYKDWTVFTRCVCGEAREFMRSHFCQLIKRPPVFGICCKSCLSKRRSEHNKNRGKRRK